MTVNEFLDRYVISSTRTNENEGEDTPATDGLRSHSCIHDKLQKHSTNRTLECGGSVQQKYESKLEEDGSKHNGSAQERKGKTRNIGYLAQHALFDQIPILSRDIVTPDYCHCDMQDGGGEDCNEEDEAPKINAWFGPEGTVSPLHFDPQHNLLAQVVGYKLVSMYSAEDSPSLYPSPTSMLHNTSQVDIENPDLGRHPKFGDAKLVKCVLGPGDMLYIPPGVWHHVRSLSGSFSVSFWFGPSSAPQLRKKKSRK
eukprot:CAMPEP_0185277338 /NCGR_PEP_ID=MMETSP1359-20130426/58364_1 /TAXON_ID=552665 /ORGANISM="Bigelowiella longifila, Strain CCMP242" /LENGTH=254 /DNA_ID=CAMNT_0027871413 /DNA_START=202 /DNA_END=966 /DNA_ORIENTATION=-